MLHAKHHRRTARPAPLSVYVNFKLMHHHLRWDEPGPLADVWAAGKLRFPL